MNIEIKPLPEDWVTSDNPLLDELDGLQAPTVMEEAHGIIHGDREQLYGHPATNLENIAEQWSLYIQQRYEVEVQLCAEDVCWMMADLKKVRQMNASKRDNLVDAIGYIGLIERIEDANEGEINDINVDS